MEFHAPSQSAADQKNRETISEFLNLLKGDGPPPLDQRAAACVAVGTAIASGRHSHPVGRMAKAYAPVLSAPIPEHITRSEVVLGAVIQSLLVMAGASAPLAGQAAADAVRACIRLADPERDIPLKDCGCEEDDDA